LASLVLVLVLVLVFGTSLAAEKVHASTVIAVVVVGVFVSRAARELLDPSRVLALHGFWETPGFVLVARVRRLVRGRRLVPGPRGASVTGGGTTGCSWRAATK
jgi:hypothetical protein